MCHTRKNTNGATQIETASPKNILNITVASLINVSRAIVSNCSRVPSNENDWVTWKYESPTIRCRKRLIFSRDNFTTRCFPPSSTIFTSNECTPLEYKCGFHFTTNNWSLAFVQFFHSSLLIRTEQLFMGLVENASIRMWVDSAQRNRFMHWKSTKKIIGLTE